MLARSAVAASQRCLVWPARFAPASSRLPKLLSRSSRFAWMPSRCSVATATAAVACSRVIAIVSVLVTGWRRGGDRGGDPVGVTGRPPTVAAHLREHGVDEPDEFGMLLGDRQAVRLIGEARAHQPGVGILGGQAGQDRVVGGDR